MANSLDSLKLLLRTLYNCAVHSVLPHVLINKCIQRQGSTLHVSDRRYVLRKNCYLVGFGKAALGMSSEIERILGEHLVSGIISVPDGILKAFQNREEMLPKPDSVLKVMEGAKNNLPDANAEKAASSIMKLVKDLNSDAILFVTVSGGGSALLPSPVPPISLLDKLSVTKLLSCAGATISELNSVRKTLSTLKGGRLAKLAYPATVITCILSDIVDDPIDSIASGPTVFNTETVLTTINIFKKYSLEERIPANVLDYVKKAAEKKFATYELPIHDGQFDHVYNCIIGNNRTALESIAVRARAEGWHPIILSSSVEGNSRHVAKLYSAFTVDISEYFFGEHTDDSLLKKMKELCESHELPLKDLMNMKSLDIPNGCKRICLIAGGETTVEVTGNGTGGRSQELSLSFGMDIYDYLRVTPCLRKCRVVILSGGTDGIDGPTNFAGAISYSQQIVLARTYGMNPLEYLDNNDSMNFFMNLNNGRDLLLIGHTGTNVMDVHIIVIEAFKT